MRWKIDFYQTESGDYPVAEFIENLPEKAQEKIIDYLDLLAEHGIQLGMPYVRDISGVRKLKELRIRYSSNIYRIFFFAFTGRKFILLHAITKKTQKTPKSDLLYSLEFLMMELFFLKEKFGCKSQRVE